MDIVFIIGSLIIRNISICIAIILAIFVIAHQVIRKILKSPFEYPYFTYEFDVSGKRLPEIDDYIDRYIIEDGFQSLYEHQQKIRKWKKECKYIISKSLVRSIRIKQYKQCLDDEHAFQFIFLRWRTNYRGYIRDDEKACSYEWLLNRYKQLESINFERPLKEYNAYNQRKLMTPELRRRIMVRDNYTCQVCGKYMPDEVGLHVDHIIPISKGGKTVESNLQVLCSKHNLQKSNKL